MLADHYDMDGINYWRTADRNEVDFVLPDLEQPFAVEIKYSDTAVKPSKYKKFMENYPEIPLNFAWMEPFDENFFRR